MEGDCGPRSKNSAPSSGKKGILLLKNVRIRLSESSLASLSILPYKVVVVFNTKYFKGNWDTVNKEGSSTFYCLPVLLLQV